MFLLVLEGTAMIGKTQITAQLVVLAGFFAPFPSVCRSLPQHKRQIIALFIFYSYPTILP